MTGIEKNPASFIYHSFFHLLLLLFYCPNISSKPNGLNKHQ